MEEKTISQRIKRLRSERKLTLQDLADRAGLTKGYLSKVERAHRAPPYATLTRIASALKVEVSTLLSGEGIPTADVRYDVSREKTRSLIRKTDPGAACEVLAPGKPGKNMAPFIIHAPFEIARTYSHEGEASLFVLDGSLALFYGDETLILNPGDHIYFDAIVPHAAKSLGPARARLLLVIYFYKRNRP